MRKSLLKITAIACSLFLTAQVFAGIRQMTDTTENVEQLHNVFALSGLKLRLAPALNAEVITVIDFGESLTLIKTLDRDLYHPPSIEWTQGSWALVDYDGMTGYIYDGFISDLPFPTPRLTNEQFGLTPLLDEYISTNLDSVFKSDTVKYHIKQDRNYHIKVKHYLADGVRYDRHQYIDKEKGVLTLPDTRITDAYQFIRALLIGYDEGQKILKNVLFKKDENGNIYEISDRFRRHLIIKSYDGQNVSVIVQDFAELGC